MQDAILNVKTKKDFIFNPNNLKIRVVSTDIVAKTAQVYYELTETGISSEGRQSREWMDKGNVTIPLDVIAGAFNQGGVPNQTVINAILANFNLELA
jgi:hypothetical protein